MHPHITAIKRFVRTNQQKITHLSKVYTETGIYVYIFACA